MSLPVPRPIRPQSGASVYGSSVLFRWAGTRAHVEVCRSSHCESPEQRSTESENTEAVLPVAPGIWFWRVVAADGRVSAVWSFELFAGVASKRSTSALVGVDYNCDAFSDVGLAGSVLFGRKEPVPNSPPLTTLDLGDLKIPELVRAPEDLPYDWDYAEPAGDIDGDGCAEMTAQVVRQAMLPDARIPVRLFFRGARDIAGHWSATSRILHRAQRIGDINEDGYADVAECQLFPRDPHCYVYAGGPNGLQTQPLFVLPHYDRLIGGADLDGDTHDDLVGFSSETLAQPLAHSVVSLYRGPLSAAPTSPDQTWSLPGSTGTVSFGDLDADGAIDIWGASSTDTNSVQVWEIPGGDANRAKAKSLGTLQLNSDDGFAFIPGVGRRQTGILAFRTGRWPDYSFAQASYPFQLRAAVKSAPQFVSDYSEERLQSVGDFNADGSDDLFVTRATDNDDVTGELYFGGPRWFSIRMPGAPFRLSSSPVSPFP